MTSNEPDFAGAVPDEVWRAVAEAAEPATLDEPTAALIERCVRAAVHSVRENGAPTHTHN